MQPWTDPRLRSDGRGPKSISLPCTAASAVGTPGDGRSWAIHYGRRFRRGDFEPCGLTFAPHDH